MNGDVHGRYASCGSTVACFSIPDRSGHLFRDAGRYPRHRSGHPVPVDAGWHADQFGEASAEGAQRRAADRETDLGDAEVATTQQRHRALDAPRHQVAVRRLAVGDPELAAEVPGRHVRAAGERLDVQRLCVLPVDPVADAAQSREVAQVIRLGGPTGHMQDRTTHRSCLAPEASDQSATEFSSTSGSSRNRWRRNSIRRSRCSNLTFRQQSTMSLALVMASHRASRSRSTGATSS